MTKEHNISSLSAWAGLIATVFYAILVTILGLLEPGFSHRTDMMSILGGVEGIRGLVFNSGVLLTGLLLIIFSFGLHKDINNGLGTKIGPVLIVVAGIGLLGSAIFACNVKCANVVETRTLIGSLHLISAFVAGSCLSISPFFIYFRMRRDVAWENYKLFTLTTGVLANLPGVILWVSFFTTRIPEWEGVIQRLGLLFPLFWVFVLSFRQLHQRTVEQ